MESLWAFIAWALIVMQMPAELPPQDSEGWPQPAFKLAIITERVGFTTRAEGMADELWEARDPETGLWVNWTGEVDVINPILGIMLYDELGQHERARETYFNALAEARRRVAAEYGYNWFWWPAISSLIVGEPMPLDLFSISAIGLNGSYATWEPVNGHGKFYANAMLSYWRHLGGPEFVPYEHDWCYDDRARRECWANTQWAKGRKYLPVMPGPYGWYTDDVLFVATMLWR